MIGICLKRLFRKKVRNAIIAEAISHDLKQTCIEILAKSSLMKKIYLLNTLVIGHESPFTDRNGAHDGGGADGATGLSAMVFVNWPPSGHAKIMPSSGGQSLKIVKNQELVFFFVCVKYRNVSMIWFSYFFQNVTNRMDYFLEQSNNLLSRVGKDVNDLTSKFSCGRSNIFYVGHNGGLFPDFPCESFIVRCIVQDQIIIWQLS